MPRDWPGATVDEHRGGALLNGSGTEGLLPGWRTAGWRWRAARKQSKVFSCLIQFMQTHSSAVPTFNDILFSFWLLSTVLRMRISGSQVPQPITYSKNQVPPHANTRKSQTFRVHAGSSQTQHSDLYFRELNVLSRGLGVIWVDVNIWSCLSLKEPSCSACGWLA